MTDDLIRRSLDVPAWRRYLTKPRSIDWDGMLRLAPSVSHRLVRAEDVARVIDALEGDQ